MLLDVAIKTEKVRIDQYRAYFWCSVPKQSLSSHTHQPSRFQISFWTSFSLLLHGSTTTSINLSSASLNLQSFCSLSYCCCMSTTCDAISISEAQFCLWWSCWFIYVCDFIWCEVQCYGNLVWGVRWNYWRVFKDFWEISKLFVIFSDKKA